MGPDRSRSLNSRFHSAAWWLMVVLFLTLTAAGLFFQLDNTFWPMLGVLFIISVTFLRGIVLAIQFSREHKRSETNWAVFLILLLLLAAALGYSL